MKIIAVLAIFYAFSDLAFAQTPCHPTPGAGDLLACYNRTEQAPAPRKRATSRAANALEKSAASKTPTDRRAPVDDILNDENKKLDAKVKSLCRGC